MIDFEQIVRTTKPFLKQAGMFIKANPHIFIEGVLAASLLVSLGYNVKAENEHEKRDKLFENRLRAYQAIIKDLSSKAQKIDELEKCNEFLMDALTKKSPNTVGA